MSLTAGIVGLPNVGKSTLFNAITKAGAEMANYPFATIEPNVGMVEVPDSRLARIQELIPAKKIVHTTFEFTDIAGLVKGASKGEGLGNKFLENIRQTDAIVHVVRAFDDDNITSVTGKVDPEEDINTINLELAIADLDAVNRRIGKVQKVAQQGDKEAKAELAVLNKLTPVLEECKAARSIDFNEDERKEFLEMEGVEESGLDRLIKAAYHILGLRTFFTAGGPETRAWTFHEGMKAPQVAGVIHSDFERGFIRAEVVSFDDLNELETMQKVKEAGKLRLEGKDYVVQDGDIIEFRFNV